MFSRSFRTVSRVVKNSKDVSLRRYLAEEASGELRATVSVPHKSLVDNVEVVRVTLPGRAGVFGVEKSSPPLVSELGPGMVVVEPLEGDAQKYIVPGGFSFVNPDNTVSVSIPEAVSADDIDADRLRELNADAISRRDASAPNTREHAEAVLQIEVYKAVEAALAKK